MNTDKLSPQQIAGRKGGLKTVRKYGKSYMRKIASIGGIVTSETYGPSYMGLLGTKGNDVKWENLSKTARTKVNREINRILENA